MRFRVVHRWYAAAFGYFWLPCPLCGQWFGGHEWRGVGGHPSVTVAEGLGRRGICPDCTAAGRVR